MVDPIAVRVAARFIAELEANDELVAKEFPTQEALKRYLQEHPNADKSKHKVNKKDDKAWSEKTDEQREWHRDIDRRRQRMIDEGIPLKEKPTEVGSR
jgi:hypothetical protein